MKTSPIRPADGILAGICAAVAFLLFLIFGAGGEAGTRVVVQTADGQSTVYSLDTPLTVTVEGQNGLRLTLTIADGSAWVTNSTCPDHVCEQGGRLSRGGRSAVCVPAGITVRVVGGADEIDGVTA